jgi:hypothetical protein
MKNSFWSDALLFTAILLIVFLLFSVVNYVVDNNTDKKCKSFGYDYGTANHIGLFKYERLCFQDVGDQLIGISLEKVIANGN